VSAAALAGAFVGVALAFRLWHLADRRAARRRRAERARWARRRGWRLHADGGTWATRWTGHPFDSGVSPRAVDVTTGRFPPYDAVVFDLEYDADRQTSLLARVAPRAAPPRDEGGVGTVAFGVHALRMPAALERLHLRAGGRARAATSLGAGELELESDQFNRAYRVVAEDPRLAVDVLTPRTMAMLLDCGAPDVRVDGEWIILVTPGPFDVTMIDAALTVLAVVIENVPGFVWTDRGVTPPAHHRSRP
jgi:hypothetical protein